MSKRVIHRLGRTASYSVWNNMMQRCYNKKHPRYKDYGKRGIKVCRRWRYSFLTFLKDMGNKPIGKSLDRKDNDKGYRKSNCRWTTDFKQNRNKRNNHIVTINGESKPIVDWANEYGISRDTFVSRIRSGWSGSKLLQPVKGK